jgi:hypothetical protein
MLKSTSQLKPEGTKGVGTHGVDKLKTPEVRSFSFVKFVGNSPSFLITAVVM